MVVLVLGLIPLVKLIGDSLVATSDLGSRSVANELAQDLLEEIKQRKWDETSVLTSSTTAPSKITLGNFTLLQADMDDASELPRQKTTFDDIDDYYSYSEKPPLDTAGNPMPQYSKFARSVDVRYAIMQPSGEFIINPLPAGNPGLGTNPIPAERTVYKLITVTVSWSSGGGKGRFVTHTTLMTNIARR